MRFNRYTVKTTSEAEDLVASVITELGVEGVEIEDKAPLSESDKAAMFVDIPPENGEDDGIAYVSFYLRPEDDTEELLLKIKDGLSELEAFCDAGELSISVKELADEDYLNSWKQYFTRFTIDDILFVPSWEEDGPIDSGKLVIHIDPGTAFGTGKHETTRMCIQALRKYTKKEDAILDVGTGSGILAIMAFKFGAEQVTATDLDIAAIDACNENMKKNGLSERDFRLYIGNLIDDRDLQEDVGYACFDIVCANILAPVLIDLMPHIRKHIKPGGIYIMSGIIDEKEEEVTEAAIKEGFEIIEACRLGEWVEITARMPG